MSTPYVFIEAEVLHRLNNLKSDSAADLVTSYETVPKTTTLVDDPGFALTSVREQIIDTMLEIIGHISRTEGDSRREPFRLTTAVSHGFPLPASMGPFGAIYDVGPPIQRLVERSAEDIFEIRRNINSVFGAAPPTFYYYAIDGNLLYHTLSGQATVDYFNYPRPATTYAALNTLFGSAANMAPLTDEFAAPWADGAAGRIGMKAGSYIAEAGAYLQAYYTGLKDRGINAQVPADYPAQPSS